MNIIDQIIDLNSVAMMTGAGLERYHMSRAEFMRMEMEIHRMCAPNVPSLGLAGFVDGVAIIVVEAKA